MKDAPATMGICGTCWGSGKVLQYNLTGIEANRCPYCLGYGIKQISAYTIRLLRETSRCEICGALSFNGACLKSSDGKPQPFHEQLKLLTEKTRAGKVFWVPRTPSGMREDLIGFMEASIDEAEDFVADSRVGEYNQKEARFALAAAAKVRAGMPWWLAQGEVRLSEDPDTARVQRQYLWVNGYDPDSMREIEKKYVPDPPELGPYPVYHLLGIRRHQWLFTAWKNNWVTQYPKDEYLPLRSATKFLYDPRYNGYRVDAQWSDLLRLYDPNVPHHFHTLLQNVGATEQEDFIAYARGTYADNFQGHFKDRLMRDAAESLEDVRVIRRQVGL